MVKFTIITSDRQKHREHSASQSVSQSVLLPSADRHEGSSDRDVAVMQAMQASAPAEAQAR